MAMKLPTDPYMAKVYWWFVGGTIAFASTIHLFDRLIYYQRSVSQSSKLIYKNLTVPQDFCSFKIYPRSCPPKKSAPPLVRNLHCHNP